MVSGEIELKVYHATANFPLVRVGFSVGFCRESWGHIGPQTADERPIIGHRRHLRAAAESSGSEPIGDGPVRDRKGCFVGRCEVVRGESSVDGSSWPR